MCYDIGKPWKHDVKISRGGQSKEMESRLVGAQRWGWGIAPSNYLATMGFPLEVLKMCWTSIGRRWPSIANVRMYEAPRIACFKMVNILWCEFYFTKKSLKKTPLSIFKLWKVKKHPCVSLTGHFLCPAQCFSKGSLEGRLRRSGVGPEKVRF